VAAAECRGPLLCVRGAARPVDAGVAGVDGAHRQSRCRVPVARRSAVGYIQQGRLLSTLLAAIADFERDLIRERTGEGRKRAMAAGIKFGRPRKLSDYQRQEAIKRRADGETLAAISKSYGVSIAMISRL
jgi:DNA invertase Pin-like site-specific DNA recombinase